MLESNSPPLTTEPFRIDLAIPGRAEFLGVVRLAIAGLAHRLGFDLGESEDLKLAVTEACSQCMQTQDQPETLSISCEVDGEHLRITIHPEPTDDTLFAPGGPAELGLFLIEALVDEVEKLDSPKGLRLTRRLMAEDHEL